MVLSSRRLDAPGTPASPALPGATWEVIVAEHAEQTLADHSQTLARQLSSGVLVTRRGEGHTAFAFSACVQRAVTPYLLDLKAPRDGLTCD